MKWWTSVVSMELRKILAYRLDFWVTFLGQIIVQVTIAHALWSELFQYQKVDTLQGFKLSELTLYYLCVNVGMKILGGQNVGFLATEIYDGSFSRYLIYPLSFFQYKTLTFITHSLFYTVQLFVLVNLFNLFFAPEFLNVASILNLLLGMVLFLFSALAYLSFAMFIEMIALWADNIWSLMVMLRFFATFMGGGLIPLSFFPHWAQLFLAWTPFPYFIELPAKTILGKTSALEIINGLGIILIWIIFGQPMVKILWNRGQKAYTGVGQ